MSDDGSGLGVMVCTLPAIALIVWAFKYGITLPQSWAAAAFSLITIAAVIFATAMVIGLLMLRGDRAMRTHRFRIDPGGAPKDAIQHEVAHVEVGNRHGGSTVGGRVYANGAGWVDVRLPRNATLAQHVAVDMAGARGEGENFWTSPHAKGDRANAAARVAHLPWAERNRVYREASQMSTPGFWHAGSGASVRRALETTGSYR